MICATNLRNRPLSIPHRLVICRAPASASNFQPPTKTAIHLVELGVTDDRHRQLPQARQYADRYAETVWMERDRIC